MGLPTRDLSYANGSDVRKMIGNGYIVPVAALGLIPILERTGALVRQPPLTSKSGTESQRLSAE